jgi:hypothetical protein
MSVLPGVGGTLFPGQFLSDGLEEAHWHAALPDLERQRRQFHGWWARVAAACGPATGIRALFDLVAMPLAGMAGFRAREAEFDRDRATARLETAGGVTVGLIVLPWATRPSGVWRDLAGFARRIGAAWTIVVAPPFISIVPARGFGVRRSVDFRLPDVLDARSFTRFQTMCRASAFERTTAAGQSGLLAQLVARGLTFQDRVRADLQHGVVEALGALGTALDRRGVAPSRLARFDEALTLVYRVLFLLFAESRDLVPCGHPTYGRSYSIAALCRTAMAGRTQTGLWEGLAAITRLSRAGCHTGDLVVRPFNGRLFARAAAPTLEAHRSTRLPTRASRARDDAIGRMLLSLASRPGHEGRQEIAYADLGVEQLGAVYEHVLDLDPDVLFDRTRIAPPRARHSQRRKESGTFYTPQPLAEFVVRRTLAPLVAGASPDRILELRVVDPAMGSGAFLVAACRFLAGAYERALIEDGQAAATDFDEDGRAGIRRLVAERCLAGVDANPQAVQLARLSLWLATLAQGKPLGFLDHRLRVGNSLIGASPDDLARAGRPGPGQSRTAPQLPFDGLDELEQTMRQVSQPLGELSHLRDDTVRDVRAKEAIWSQLASRQSPLEPWRLACSLWCARWFWPAGTPPSPAEFRATTDALLKRDTTLAASQVAAFLDTARLVGANQRFFHWPLEFADVFYNGAGQPRPAAGFDAVIGNPPWEMLRKDAGNDARDEASALMKFVRESGLYPSCGHGHLNLYQPFLERALSLAHAEGRVGMIVPWGLAGDDGAMALREKLLDRSRVHTIVGLDNAGAIFPVHRGLRFLVVVASPGGATGVIRARFGVRSVEEIENLPARENSFDATAYPVRLTSRLLARIGGTARRIPDVRGQNHLAFLRDVVDRFPALGSDSGWSAEFGRELNATDDRGSFGTRGLPVIEGKHIAPFVASIGDTAQRISRDRARARLPGLGFERPRLAYRDVSSVSNRLSLIAAIVPPLVVTTHTLLCLRTPMPLVRQHFLCALFNSYVLNAVVRMLMGGHVTTRLIEGLPVPLWTGDAIQRRIALLAHRIARRPQDGVAHADIQASIARLYALDSQTFQTVLDSFPLVSRQERDRARRTFASMR